MAGIVVDALTWLLCRGVLVVLRLVLMLVVAVRHTAGAPSRLLVGAAGDGAGLVIVPAYNEKENIAATVRSLVASEHPVEVIVVDDGSTDGTADIVEALGLPNVRVIRQANGGQALRAQHRHRARPHQLVVMIDGDTVFEPKTVGRLVQPFADPGRRGRRQRQGARPARARRWQHIEYVMGFNVDRRVYDVLRCMPTIPGAVGAFRRAALLEVGGVSEDTLAEDTDLTMAICRSGWRVVYQESARAWTEAPATLGQLWRQRYRWSYGTMQSMWKHRRAVLQPGAAAGRPAGLAYLAMFQVLLPLLAPLVDIFLVYGLIFLDPVTTLLAVGGCSRSRSARRAPSGSRASRSRLWVCRCSRSSTASSCTGAHPVGGHRRCRIPAGLAEAAPRRRARGPATGRVGAGDDGDPARAARGAQPAVTRVVGATPVTSAGGAGP